MVLSGFFCSGKYCDNPQLRCSRLASNYRVVWNDDKYTDWFSEEQSSSAGVCPDGYYVWGIACKGRYCDKLKLRCAKIEVDLGTAIPPRICDGITIPQVPHTSAELLTINSPPSWMMTYYKKFQPAIKLDEACAPYPAVGEYKRSGGLQKGFTIGCRSSGGQVYARHWNFKREGKYNCAGWNTGTGVRGIMYAYYMPKDRTHRHDWENVVVWTDWDFTKVLEASLSRHGRYVTFDKNWMHGTHKQVLVGEHHGSIAMKDPYHSWDKTEAGYSYEHPLANWYQLPQNIRDTLNCASFGTTTSTIKNGEKMTFFDAMHSAFINACKKFS